ncbi:hypothetical protein PR003_g34302 [Phytophthora rubi]|uniref:Secreted protein n=1 Tax=Phytophthora rubi TaxID=129364 RepID=A0A6A3NIX8_9STRA|nr:hypothetical protein PR001_g10767 [Phytophthora rubi]KAE9043480.1 hypothetical protein PR002_g3308 [Phytophthora rubi]KAE9260590.1 hypothetical protein PR003_g34302 [Phytophthora rubi]
MVLLHRALICSICSSFCTSTLIHRQQDRLAPRALICSICSCSLHFPQACPSSAVILSTKS